MITPYQKAQRTWDERIGCAQQQAKHWRLACLLSVVAFLVCLIILMMVLRQRKQLIYVVRVGPGQSK